MHNKRLLSWYGLGSLLVVATWSLGAFGPGWHRDALNTYEQNLPLTAGEYLMLYLGYLLFPALYGLGVLVIARAPGRIKNLARPYLVVAVLVGLVSVGVNWMFDNLGHLDCNTNCIAAVPSYQAITWMTWLALGPVVLAPIITLKGLQDHEKAAKSNRLAIRRWLYGCMVLGLLAITVTVVWFVVARPKTLQSDIYYRDTYTKPSQKDECVADYYRAHPEALPENQKPGYIYLPPPCPGIPQ